MYKFQNIIRNCEISTSSNTVCSFKLAQNEGPRIYGVQTLGIQSSR